MAGWKKKLLSQGERLILVKHVLSSILIHVFVVIEPPKKILQQPERIMAEFYWGDTETGIRHHWCRWKGLCSSTIEGGLGLRNLEDMLKAFSWKLCWKFENSNSLWASFVASKYEG